MYVQCSLMCLYIYAIGIFHDKTGNRDIDHDIEVVGWGEEDGVKFWNVRNSWGTYTAIYLHVYSI